MLNAKYPFRFQLRHLTESSKYRKGNGQKKKETHHPKQLLKYTEYTFKKTDTI